ncbi:biotin-dependent carboxyltransferase family protein [Sinirhodobacter sp. HNIBRBA609]|nr:biotin-dependent carboxyltransferase family protein [Sinirhodobacter sp. HNIBRBA609]
MTGWLDILSIGPSVSVQDLGRPGHLAQGLRPGGGADRRALYEAAALLGQAAPRACLEMAGMGGRFRTTLDTRIALTGAPMRALLEGAPLRWNASHLLPAGSVLELGPCESGAYGYLSFGGGLACAPLIGAQSAHLAAGIGERLQAATRLPLVADPTPDAPSLALIPEPRLSGGTLRVIPGPQTALFSATERARFFDTAFTVTRGNRQGVTLAHPGAPFAPDAAGSLVSDLITAGDIQMTGAGTPMVLLAECQTVGGYPRLGTILPVDLPILAQASPGTTLRFREIGLREAEVVSPPESQWLAPLRRACQPLTRSAHDIADLLGYQLISGMVRGDEEET